MSSPSVQSEPLSWGCRSSLLRNISYTLRAAEFLRRVDIGNHRGCFRAVWVVASLSLTSMRHVKQRGNEHCPVDQSCLQQNADSMRSVRLAIGGASEVRSYAHACAPDSQAHRPHRVGV